MRGKPWRHTWSLLLMFLAGCGDQTEPPDQPGVLPDPPDLVGMVYQITYRSGASPNGHIEQYELWIGPPGSTAPDAGLVVGAGIPVFRRVNGELVPTTGAAIAAGDRIEAWRDGAGGAYGSVQAPPGAPAYFALQVIIPRP